MSPDPLYIPFALDERLWGFCGAVAEAGFPSLDKIAEALDQAMLALTGASDPREQWSYFFSPLDIVGIKVNCRLGPGHSTFPLLAKAIAHRLRSIGIAKDKIIIWDRRKEDLVNAYFSINVSARGVLESIPESGFRCFGIEDIFDPEFTESGRIAGRLSMIVSRICTALISVPVLRYHPIDSLDGGMRNLSDALENNYKLNSPAREPLMADFFAMPAIREKWRLGVFQDTEHSALLVSPDPVALDAEALKRLNQSRSDRGQKILHPSYLEAAEGMGLGSTGTTLSTCESPTS